MSRGKKYQRKPRRPLTAQEYGWLEALRRCSLPVASWTKRFLRQGDFETEGITVRQAEILPQLVYRFRRQIKAELVREAVEAGGIVEKAVEVKPIEPIPMLWSGNQ